MTFRSLCIATIMILSARSHVDASSTGTTESRQLRAAIDADFQAKMLAAVNAERKAAGLSPMCTNKKLQTAAQLHSEDMANKNFMSHDGSNGSNFADRINAQGFSSGNVAENVAAGQVDVAAVMESWMSSPGHKANILGSGKFFGTGYSYSASSTYKHYWTQDFGNDDEETCDGNSAGQTPVVTPAPPTPSSNTPTPVPKSNSGTPSTSTPVTTAPASRSPAKRGRRSKYFMHRQRTAPTSSGNSSPEIPAQSTEQSVQQQQQQLLEAVNAERAAAGLQPLCMNKKLQTAAQLHSEDMANKNFMSHDGSNGSNFADRIKAQGFTWSAVAENVAAGQVDVAAVMESWMSSPGHKANILGNSKFFGMGYSYSASSTYKHYWTQDFATGNGETCD